MAETFELSILLTAKDNASKELNGLLKQLSALDKQAGQTMSAFEKMQTKVGKSFDNGGRSLERYSKQTEKHSKIVGKLANLNDKYIEPAREIGNIWKSQYDSLKVYTDEASSFYQKQAQFRLLNLSETDNNKAFSAVRQITKDIKGATLTEATEDITDLYGALGDLNSAIDAMPLATKYRVNFKALYGDEMSDAQIGKQIQNSFKFLELIGTTGKGLDETQKKLNTITKISNSTGGRVTSVDLLQMARRGGASVQGLSDDGLRTVSSLIEELGGDRTGSSLMSMYQALVGGKMKQSSAQRFVDLGLIDKSKIEYGKGGKVKNILPGGNILGKLMQEDPLKAADALTEAMKAKGVNTSDVKAVNQELATLFGNRSAQQMMSMLINNRSQVDKEVKKATDAMGLDKMDEIAKEAKGIQEFEAAIKNFKVEAGIPLLQIGTQFTQMATPILKFFGEHPTLTQFAMGALLAGKGLSAIAQTASILKSSGLGSVFSNATSQATSMGTALGGATSKAKGLRGAMSRISSSPIGITLSVLAITGLVELISWEIQQALKARASFDRAEKASQESYKAFTEAKKQGVKFSEKDHKTTASSAWFSAMNLGLKESLRSEFLNQSLWSQFSQSFRERVLYPVDSNKFQHGGFGSYFSDRRNNVNAMAQGFKKTTPQLQESQTMLQFLKQLPSRVKDTNDQKVVKDSLQQAFPKSFETAMQSLSKTATDQSQSFAQQKQSLDSANQSLSLFPPPLDLSSNSLNQFGNTAQQTSPSLMEINQASNTAVAGLRNVGSQMLNWNAPTPQVQTFSIGVPQQSKSNNWWEMPSRAIGGVVERDGVAQVHAGNVITPAKVSKGLDLSKFSGSGSGGNLTIQYSPNTTIDGASASAKQDFQKMLDEHSKHIERIVADKMGNGRVRA